jgi:hypothetical protein
LPKFIHRFLRLRMISFQSMYRKKEQQIWMDAGGGYMDMDGGGEGDKLYEGG